MEIRLLASPADLEAYDAWVCSHPEGTLWQSLAWKRYQEALGRKSHVYAAFEGDTIVMSALAVSDYTVMNLSVWDIPRGPLGYARQQTSDLRHQTLDIRCQTLDVSLLLKRIIEDAKKDRCVSLYLSPLQPLQATSYKLKDSPRHEQPEATRIVDLTLLEEDLLKQMHQKGRYNIKVAEKSGVRVERSVDAAAFARLLQSTAARDGFSASSSKHYETFLKHLNGSFLLLAYAGESTQPIAGLMGVIWGKMGIYYYGASDYEHRALMAPYLLQWEAIRQCKESGCMGYDLLGIAPPNAPDDHPWQGISRFKEKFGGETVVYPAERQIMMRPAAYAGLWLKRRLLS